MPSGREIKHIAFRNPRLVKIGVEVLTLQQLRARAPSTLTSPQRVDFFALTFLTEGQGTHSVDFQEHEVAAGSLIFVRRGQVQQWRLNDSLQGLLVLTAAEALAPAIARGAIDMAAMTLDRWPPVAQLGASAFASVRADIERLRDEVERFSGRDLDAAIVWHQLYGLLLRLAREFRDADEGRGNRAEAQLHLRFIRALETSYMRRQGVAAYARELGCSESSLSRACLNVTGQTAKQIRDERIGLEAKRWLVHGHESVKQIGARLGFSEPTNFIKFFKRIAGTTPSEFRARMAQAPAKSQN